MNLTEIYWNEIDLKAFLKIMSFQFFNSSCKIANTARTIDLRVHTPIYQPNLLGMNNLYVIIVFFWIGNYKTVLVPAFAPQSIVPTLGTVPTKGFLKMFRKKSHNTFLYFQILPITLALVYLRKKNYGNYFTSFHVLAMKKRCVKRVKS